VGGGWIQNARKLALIAFQEFVRGTYSLQPRRKIGNVLRFVHERVAESIFGDFDSAVEKPDFAGLERRRRRRSLRGRRLNLLRFSRSFAGYMLDFWG
jgi:hypothetical protein